jgi:hypothetical protein
MPTREPIVNTMLPKEVEKPIPVRTVQTRLTPKVKPSGDQPSIDKGPAESVTPPTAESVKLSPQLSALARKEQEFRRKEAAFKEREKSIESKLIDADRFLKFQEKLKAKDYSVAEEMGLEYEGYTNYLLNKRGQDPQTAEMQKMADELAAMKKSQEDKETEAFEDSKKEYLSRIKELSGSTDFSSIKELGREEAVLQFILDSLDEDEPELKELDFEGTIKWAMTIVEMDAVEEGKKFSTLSKLKPKEEPKVEEAPRKQLPLKTLTNQVRVESPEQLKPLKSLQHMSETERIEEARRRVMARKQTNG